MLNLSVNEAVMSLTLAYSSFTEKQCLDIEIGGGGGVSSKCLNIFCGQLYIKITRVLDHNIIHACNEILLSSSAGAVLYLYEIHGYILFVLATTFDLKISSY